jgi:hypothetical protein
VKADDCDLWLNDVDDGLSPPQQALHCKGAPRRRNSPFVQVSLEAVYRLGAAKNTSTLKLYLLLLHLKWKADGEPVKLTNGALAGVGVSRRQKAVALRELEKLKLVRVVRRGRKSPLVVVLATPAK